MEPLKAKSREDIAHHFAAKMARVTDDAAQCHTHDHPHIAIAVSGGADSFALLHLAYEWALQQGAEITALTIDHQLRADSLHEAQHVATWCKEHGIPHHILAWQGTKPTSAIQNTARTMRRKLLLDFCATHKINHLLLGHQADDQVETFFMRLLRGSGVKGLSSMHEDILNDADDMNEKSTEAVAVLRPLLMIKRRDLRAYCMQQNIPFIDDPSNENPSFERVRMRHLLRHLPADFAEQLKTGITLATKRLQRADQALDQLADQWMQQHIHSMNQEIYWVSRNVFISCHEEIRLRVLARLTYLLTGETRPSLSDMEDWSYRLLRADFSGMNIAGCWARPKKINGVQGIAFQQEPSRKYA